MKYLTKQASKRPKEERTSTLATSLGYQAVKGAPDKIVGNKSMYHGTSRAAWESIKTEGLDPRKGASGGATEALKNFLNNASPGAGDAAGARFKANSKGYTHFTNSPTAARLMSFLSGMGHGDRGKVVRVKMPFAAWEKFKGSVDMDTDWGPTNTNPDGMGAGYKTKKKINPDAFLNNAGSKLKRGKALLKQFPSYIKNNPGRFAKGVGRATLGTALINYGLVQPLKNRFNKTASIIDAYRVECGQSPQKPR